jgi:hypothetical protein
VWFTHADLIWIGAHLTDLMPGRTAGEPNVDVEHDAPEGDADLLGRFAGLGSCRT